MNVQEWTECTRLHEMFELVAGRMGPRKLRLFACACCRRIPREFCTPAGLRALDASEKFADGLATEEQLADARMWAFDAYVLERERPAGSEEGQPPWSLQAEMASRALSLVASNGIYNALDAAESARMTLSSPHGEAHVVEAAEEAVQCGLLREVLGPLLFRPVALSPNLLTPEVLRMAQEADRGDWSVLPILGDALEEAGCVEGDLLEHLRGPDTHVRGCWALDLVLGRE